MADTGTLSVSSSISRWRSWSSHVIRSIIFNASLVLAIADLFLVGMACGITLKRLLSPDRPFDIRIKDFPFFGQGVSEHRNAPPIKEIEHPVVLPGLSEPAVHECPPVRNLPLLL